MQPEFGPLKGRLKGALPFVRGSSHGQVYMVTTVTAGRQPFFLDFTLARCVIAEMRHIHTTGKVDSLAWVLMPDHLHWLFQLGDAGTLAEVMQSFKGRSARAINKLMEDFNDRSAHLVNLMDGRQRSIWQRG